MPNGHPGCIVATAAYQDRLFDRSVGAANRAACLNWRRRFRAMLDRVAERTPPADAVDYWLSDGVYGCLNSIIYDDACLVFLPLRLQQAEDGDGFDGADAVMPPCTATLYGPTCDSADVVARGVALPRLAVGDFVLCPRASAYSIAGASNFNGFQAAKAGAVYVYSLSGKGEVGCAV
jgi:hypothetical protein